MLLAKRKRHLRVFRFIWASTTFGMGTRDVNAWDETFFRNDNQIQWEQSVRCGYYCLLFLNERNKETSFADVLEMFSNDLLQNEEIVKNYFS